MLNVEIDDWMYEVYALNQDLSWLDGYIYENLVEFCIEV